MRHLKWRRLRKFVLFLLKIYENPENQKRAKGIVDTVVAELIVYAIISLLSVLFSTVHNWLVG